MVWELYLHTLWRSLLELAAIGLSRKPLVSQFLNWNYFFTWFQSSQAPIWALLNQRMNHLTTLNQTI
jgi:hypothetical protein